MASALTTTAKVDTYLGAHSFTAAQVTAAVAAANAQIESYCDRIFTATYYYEWQQVTSKTLRLKQYPIIRAISLLTDPDDVLGVRFSHADAKRAQVGVAGGVMTLTNYTPDDASSGHATITLADNATLAELEANIELLTGWEATVVLDVPPVSLLPMSTDDCSKQIGYLKGPTDMLTGYSIDYEAGLVELCRMCSNWVYAEYRAGYETIPSDLEQIATELAADILKGTLINTGLQSEKIGDYSYTARSDGGSVITPYIQRLSTYKRRCL